MQRTRPRNLTIATEISPSLTMVPPSMNAQSSSSGSGSPTRDSIARTSSSLRSSSPLKVDTSIGTPSFSTPSPFARRTLTYSPTKRSNAWSQRIILVLVGLICASVLLTFVSTVLLMDDDTEPDRGLTFGTPSHHQVKTNVVNLPRIRGQEHDPRTNLTNTLSENDAAHERPLVDSATKKSLHGLKNIVSIVKDREDEKATKNHKEKPEPNQVVENDKDPIVVPNDNNDVADVNGLEDNIEEMPDKHPDASGDKLTKSGHYPRVVYFDTNDPPPVRIESFELPDDEMLHAPPGFEAVPQDKPKADYTQGDCVPMHDWQTKSFPNCNLLHEYDLRAAGPGIYKNNTNLVLEDNVTFLGQGWFRSAWRLNAGATDDNVVLKTLRLEREFYDEFYDLHRRDAVAMERLTHSPFIMNIYGYCGQSALNELAEFGKGDLASLEKVNRRMRGNEDPNTYLLKLQLGASVAVGVAHIHEIDDDDRPSMAHYDLNPRNVAMVGAGKPKINDFNIAEFLHWNTKTNETCGFPSRLHEPWWRAPEEVSLEKDNRTVASEVDVYALGSILFHILTTHSPRGKMKKERAEEVREKVLRGEAPFLQPKYTESKLGSVVAFREAMKLCFEPDPKKRGTARQVADIMLTALMAEKKKRKKKPPKHGHH